MPDATPRFEGEEIKLGDKIYIVPALSLRQVQRLSPQVDKVMADTTELPEFAQMDAMIDVLHAALSRNYPEMTKEELLDLVDVGNMSALLKAAMRTSGFVLKGEGKA